MTAGRRPYTVFEFLFEGRVLCFGFTGALMPPLNDVVTRGLFYSRGVSNLFSSPAKSFLWLPSGGGCFIMAKPHQCVIAAAHQKKKKISTYAWVLVLKLGAGGFPNVYSVKANISHEKNLTHHQTKMSTLCFLTTKERLIVLSVTQHLLEEIDGKSIIQSKNIDSLSSL